MHTLGMVERADPTEMTAPQICKLYAATAADIGGHVVGQTLHGVYTVYNGKLVIIIIADKYMKTIHIINSMENYQLVIAMINLPEHMINLR